MVSVCIVHKILAGPLGIEPRSRDSKSLVLPLDEGPKLIGEIFGDVVSHHLLRNVFSIAVILQRVEPIIQRSATLFSRLDSNQHYMALMGHCVPLHY